MNTKKLWNLLNDAADELDNEDLSVSEVAKLVSDLRQAAKELSDEKGPTDIKLILQDGDDVLSGTSPSNSTELLATLGRVLDKAGMTSTVMFMGEDDKIYVATFEAEISLANPEFVKDAALSICGNCSYFDGDEHDPAEIKDLLTRVEPGEPMPAGQCPECGALMHRVEQHESVSSDG